MPRKLGSVSRSVLLNAPLPSATKSYTVISHSFIINAINAHLQQNSFGIANELYKCTKDAQQAVGKFILDYNNDPELQLSYSFVNSYNKTIKFGATFGAYVKESESFMIGALGNWNRKHTGTADQETNAKIGEQMADAKEYYEDLRLTKDSMKTHTITKNEFGALLGIFYINGFMSKDMVSIATQEYHKPSYNYSLGKDNLWTCYNHILHALKQSNPKVWMNNQSAIHFYITNQYKLDEYQEGFDNTTIDDHEDLMYDLNSPQIQDIPNGDTMSNTSDDEILLPLGFDDFNSCPPADVEVKTEIVSSGDELLDTIVENTDTRDLQQLPGEVMEEAKVEGNILYIPLDEFPDAVIGDIIFYESDDTEGEYLEVTNIIDDLLALKPLTLEKCKEAGTVGEHVRLHVVEAEEPVTPEIPSTNVSFDLDAEESEDEEVEVASLELEDEVVKQDLTVEEMESISTTVSEIFNSEDIDFNVEVSGEDYIVNLTSGESLVLPKSAVNS
tara:strand:- start:6646 stop:8148 length:1503 start_codon:yes stop_codon:yes gene_type:complete